MTQRVVSPAHSGAGALRITVALCAIVAGASTLGAQDIDAGRDALRTGKYQEAIAILSKVPATDSQWVAAQRELTRAYATIGKYDEAENTARRGTAAKGGAEMWNTLGEVLLVRGKRAPAESAFVRAGAERASDSLTAALNLAVLHYDRGERDKAMKEFDRFIDVYNKSAGGELTSEELAAVGTAVEYLGANDPQLFKDALKAFDRAISSDPSNSDAKNQLGELFLKKYNFADAQKTFDDVLQTNGNDPRALLGAARRLEADGQAGGDSLLRAALNINPEYVEARTLHAEMLLGLEDYAGAQQDIDRALKVNPTADHTLAVAAAIKYLSHDQAGFEAARQRALALNPIDADLYSTLGELAAQVRLYKPAADFAKQAVTLDPKDSHAWSVLGMNELRLGQIADGKKSLETSFSGDPYNVWVKNTLDLLDTYKNYDLSKSEHFQFMIEKSESPILSIYLKDLAEQAYATFSKKYAYTPPPPVRIEVYRSHSDFSVRTVGLAGLGALGVSFGTTLAFDSPAAKDAGPFNWGSTVWHELAHTFTLGTTDNRVPRWLSEGLSVYEEHHAKPGWGFGVSPDFLAAFKAGKLVPVSRMNDGFMHPAYPEQVQFSYYQASLVCELIARDYGGDAALLKMLQAYKEGSTTDQVFLKILNVDIKAFDKKFDDYLRTRFSGVLASITKEPPAINRSMSPEELQKTAASAPNDFGVQLLAGMGLLAHNKPDEAIPILEKARTMFPEYGGADSPYALLAAAYEKKGDLRKQADLLTQWTALTETDFKALTTLADVLQKLGDSHGAADALDRAMFVNPFDLTLHVRLAELSKAAGDKQRTVRERAAIVALGPVDKADALYQLALAQHDVGDDVHARTSVLRALEEAPNYERAQTLLLTLYDARVRPNGERQP
ncbi:MAG TPA: tetratricopeptide repeat protein [Gemmatimonadaceae bacterium]|nr:tetratricopeptide repeat protein [Gemmatimonadaceae bacterium]